MFDILHAIIHLLFNPHPVAIPALRHSFHVLYRQWHVIGCCRLAQATGRHFLLRKICLVMPRIQQGVKLLKLARPAN